MFVPAKSAANRLTQYLEKKSPQLNEIIFAGGHSLHLLNRVPDYGFQLVQRGLSCVTQIDFVVVSRISNVKDIPLFRHKLMHELHCCRLIVVWADVHTLNTEPLVT